MNLYTLNLTFFSSINKAYDTTYQIHRLRQTYSTDTDRTIRIREIVFEIIKKILNLFISLVSR